MNIKFIGRKQELDYLEELLQKPNFSASLVSGLGGVGKTRLLKHFCEIAAEQGHWVHFLSLQTFRGTGTTELSYLFAESLSSGKYLIGKEPNLWKDLLQSNQKIANQLLPLIEHPYEDDTSNKLKNIIELITKQIPNKSQLVIVFDEIEASQNPEGAVLFLESLIRALSNSTKIKLVFSSRPIPYLDRLSRYHNLSRISLKGFSSTDLKEYISNSLVELNPTAEYLENFTKEITEQSQGSPLITSLILEQVKQAGLDHAPKYSDKNPVSLENLIGQEINAISKNREDVLNLIIVCVLLGGSASVGTLMQLLDKNQFEFAKIKEQASHYIFIRFNETESVIVHDAFHEYVIRNYIFPKQFKPTLLDFGSEEAERDQLLETSFIFNNSLDEIFSGRKNIILGDRGAGKSSIFRFISDIGKFSLPSNKKKLYQALAKKMLIVPCDDPTSIIQDNPLFDDQNTTPEKYKMFWLLYIALLSGVAIYKQGNYTNPQNWKDLTDILKSMGALDKIDSADTSLFRPILDLITKVGSKVSFSVAGIPISFEPSAELKHDTPSVKIDITQLLELANLNAINLNQHLIILIDKVDEIFKYQRGKQEKFVQGLFLAISYLSKYSNISLTVFLRTDIFQIYDIQEKNKFVSRSLNLTWNQQDILKLLVKRLGTNKALQGVRRYIKIDGKTSEEKVRSSLNLVFPEQVEGMPFVEWFIKMTRNGKSHISPRQIILFLFILKDILINSRTDYLWTPIFTDAEVKQAISYLSELSYEEVLSDFRVSPTFIRNCRAGKISEFSLDDKIKGLFSEDEGTINSQIDLLEKLGVLERIVKNDSETGLSSTFKFPDLYTRCWYS